MQMQRHRDAKAMRQGKSDEETKSRWLSIEFDSRGEFLRRSQDTGVPGTMNERTITIRIRNSAQKLIRAAPSHEGRSRHIAREAGGGLDLGRVPGQPKRVA